jgi:long-chain acyl-CoA synthetase
MQVKPFNLVDMLHQNVMRFPNKEAIRWKEGKYIGMSYSELWDHIRSFAHGLSRLGIGRGSKVAILAENGPKWLISDFAVLSLGAVSVPVYPTLTGKQVADILFYADVEAIIVQNAAKVKNVRWPEGVKTRIAMYGDVPEGYLSFDELVQQGKKDNGQKHRWGWESIQRDDLATIVHTSGTTGRPKGAMLSHGNILSNIEQILHYVPVNHEDTNLSFLPLSHIFERTAGHFAPMYVGGTIAYAESLERVPANLLEVKPTAITSVPRLFEKIYSRVMEQAASGSRLKQRIFHWALKVGAEKCRYTEQGYGYPVPFWVQLRSLLADKLVFSAIRQKTGGNLRLLVSGGAALDAKISRFFAQIGMPVVEGYGMTECSPIVACNPLLRIKPGTVGRPLPLTEVDLADDGELLVKSPSVMMGYYNQPEETANTIVNGWLHTGDIVQMDQEGYIRIVDRKKSIFVLSTGKNVAPQPIESTLCTSRFIHQAALIGNKRKYVSALIVPDYDSLIQYARANGWSAKTRRELAHSKLAHDLIRDEMSRLLRDFASFEQPKKFTLLEEEFSIEKGELTPTLKIRLKKIEENYAREIALMYEEALEGESPASQEPDSGEYTGSAEVAAARQTSSSETTKPGATTMNPSSFNWVSALASAIIFARVIINPKVLTGIAIGVIAGILVQYLW